MIWFRNPRDLRLSFGSFRRSYFLRSLDNFNHFKCHLLSNVVQLRYKIQAHSSIQNMPSRTQPKYKITWWLRLQSKIRRFETPLRLRDSIGRLRHDHHYPFLALLKLFVMPLQKPSWNWSYDYPLPEPLAPKDIASNEALFGRYHSFIFNLRYIPVQTIRDTPLRALYRLYEIFMTLEFELLRLECEYI
jgi:hypothetical protein